MTETPFFFGAAFDPAGKKVLKKLGSSCLMVTSRSLLLFIADELSFLGSIGFSGPLAAEIRSLTSDMA